MSGESSEYVPLAEHEILKDKYESLRREHETLIKTHGFTLIDLAKKQREAVVAKEDVDKWESKFGELEKKLEVVENEIQGLMSLEETEMNGVDSAGAALAENLNLNNSNSVPTEEVIEISDDDDGGNQSESDRGNSYSEYSFFL